MHPILFTVCGPKLNQSPARLLGVPPVLCGRFPLPKKYFAIAGITKDSNSAPLASCTVQLYATQTHAVIGTQISGADGTYEFRETNGYQQHYAVAYKPGAPDVAGTTANTLVGV